MQQLESRLDNLIYRAGLANSRSQARQIVIHGFLYVNNHKVNIPSYLVKIGDTIKINEHKKGSKYLENILPLFKKMEDKPWFKSNKEKGEIEIKSLPSTEDFEIGLDMALIVEFYSR